VTFYYFSEAWTIFLTINGSEDAESRKVVPFGLENDIYHI